MRQLRLLGISAVSILVLAGCFAAGSAVASQFRAEQYEAVVSGTLANESEARQEIMRFSSASDALKCSGAALSGALVSASGSLSVTPNYSNCTALGVKGTVAPNSCQLVLNSTNSSPPLTGTLGVSCTKGGDAIVINAPSLSCKVEIPAQGAHSGLGFTNTGLNRRRGISATANVSGLKYIKSGAGCAGKPNEGTFENGTATGGYSFKANPVGLPSSPDGLYIADEQIAAGQAMLRAEQFPTLLQGGPSVFNFLLGYNVKGTGYFEEVATEPVADLQLNAGFESTATIKMNGCQFVFHLVNDEQGSGGISCTGGSGIVLENGAYSYCTQEIPAQSGLSGLTFARVGSGSSRAIEVNVQLYQVKYTATGSGCPKVGTYTSGSITGGTTLHGYRYELANRQKGSEEGVWIE